jgi:hypothetical protein
MKTYSVAMNLHFRAWRAIVPVLLLCGLAVLTLSGCSTMRPGAQSAGSAAPAAIKQGGLELEAYAKGNVVHVSLTNHTAIAVVAGPNAFGVIEKGKRSVTPYNAGMDRALLPVTQLANGDNVQGDLTFRAFRDLTGSRLVFISDEAAPVFCEIKSAAEVEWPTLPSAAKARPAR